ncbi:gas vesicle protein [Micromonospora musae]|uniref:Gas vesicle protein A n=1 Tax=Micromonospora musae TaxID=1894970 RepID=A0A3A9Y0Z5_9ACTN|nr:MULTISPECIES: gas vesicle protein GvpJ [Micromonospora]RKN17146.1 gas vesicle protein [Micromonospora musae]RKN31078.1 gas vesicle protein [Micromonospora musae]TYC01057.1 gas vesicle protein [Micromonospora sp. WP24]
MTIATNDGQAGGALQRSGSSSGLADVVETVLDKGVVIDAQISVAVVGIQLLEINARVVVASVETYLRFAQAVDRLDITPRNQKGLPDLVQGATGAVTAGKAASGLGKTVGAIGGAVRDAVGELGTDRERERPRRRRRSEEQHDE